jgi:hypothetical protein
MSRRIWESPSQPVKRRRSPAPQSAPGGRADAPLGDLRFRALLSDDDWQSLPLATRRRFSKRLADGQSAIYLGTMVRAFISPIGWVLANVARLIGGPLPVGRDVDVPFIVTVTEEMATGGQIWTRICTRRHRFPQVIHSSKRFSGPTGLEEYIGFGLSVALTILVEDRSLRFRSAGYFLKIGSRRLRWPDWAAPGTLTVGHADLGEGEFLFTLELVHPRFGHLIDHAAVFREAAPQGPQPCADV